MTGTETTSLLNCSVFDAADIVSEDVVDAEKYDVIVDLSGSAEFSHKNSGRICRAGDLSRRLDDLLPCEADGNAMKQLTKTDDGRYYLLLTNNSGVVRTVERGDEFLPGAAETVSVRIKDGRSLAGLEGSPLTRDDHGVYHTEIPAGGYFFGMIA